MPTLLTLQQAAAKAIVCALCKKSNIDKDVFFDMLPLPVALKVKLKDCCHCNIIGDVIYRMIACNMWLEVEGNYHEEYIREYYVALEHIRDGFLPFEMKIHGI